MEMVFSLSQLIMMPTLEMSHDSDLKYDDGMMRVWLSRLSKSDGEPYDNTVYVEEYVDSNWSLIGCYDASSV